MEGIGRFHCNYKINHDLHNSSTYKLNLLIFQNLLRKDLFQNLYNGTTQRVSSGLMANMMSRNYREYCLGGNYIRRNFLDCNNPGGNFPGGNFPGGSYPGWEFSRWEFSRWELSWVEIFWVGIVRVGVILGWNCPGGSYSGWVFSGWEFS